MQLSSFSAIFIKPFSKSLKVKIPSAIMVSLTFHSVFTTFKNPKNLICQIFTRHFLIKNYLFYLFFIQNFCIQLSLISHIFSSFLQTSIQMKILILMQSWFSKSHVMNDHSAIMKLTYLDNCGKRIRLFFSLQVLRSERFFINHYPFLSKFISVNVRKLLVSE